MLDNKFKVVVIGSGPVGLTAAHALSQAGIDFIVLEHRASVVVDVGAAMSIWPHGFRVLAQLGLLERLEKIGVEVGRTMSLTLEGHKYKENNAARAIKVNHGTCQFMTHRANLLDVLYGTLSDADKSRILTNKKVTNITTHADGVIVHCEDGSTHKGSIVIGADGAHSFVRQKMRELAIQSSSPATPLNEEKPYLSEYRIMWCTFPRQPGGEPGDAFDIHGTDVSLQTLTGLDRTWVFVYERLENLTPERVAYTQADVEALAARHGECAITETLRLKDVFPLRVTAGMTNLEEGILRHWSWNRIVLVGDACHKMTPNLGQGFNNGVQDVVVLVNELYRIVPSGVVDTDVLEGAFARYQAARIDLLKKEYAGSAAWTRMSAWRNGTYRVLDRYIIPAIPWFDGFFISKVVSPRISKMAVLDFVEGEESFKGKMPWKNGIKVRGKKLAE
ncbi:hypothetical protein B0H63DRAFT_538208 [Podospora didyma]|uniref:FAD-binding domain-containing protein n=1 Tax=Podospora didyma TaxID=330526 RepID=A0AAE0NYR9_9PEZI|nr:hypothetical protein B0H63DRAFT_538208 [Podospora didyma]